MMIPITRKEKYINEIVGGGDTAPKTPQTREEFFFAAILGEVIAPSPVTRVEKYLSAIAGQYSGELPEPVTRIERFIARAAGMDVNTPTPVTREEMFWANYALIVEKELSGIPPLTFKAKKAGTLNNYRIYGNTENGENVGDLITEGEHAGEYKVPVTVEGKNLCNNIWEQGGIDANTGNVVSNPNIVCCDFIPVKPDVTYSCSRTIANNFINLRCYGANKNYLGTGATLANKGNPLAYGELFGTFMITDARVSYIRFNDYSDALDTKYMLVEGIYTAETMPPYEPWRVPVTTLIYLPEPIKMVGDEAEYLDYGEQKMHRVRKNLLNDKLSLNATLGTLSSEPPILGFPQSIGGNRRTYFLTVAPGEQYTISMSTPGDRLGICGYYNIVDPHEYTMENKLISDVVILPIVITSVPSTYTFTVPNNVVMVAIYYSLSTHPIQIQIEKGSTATPYEPYIENTDLDVTLPELPTLAGTNTLTVGTAVQPSGVEIKGKIQEVTL